jgi:hypothetical protein
MLFPALLLGFIDLVKGKEFLSLIQLPHVRAQQQAFFETEFESSLSMTCRDFIFS